MERAADLSLGPGERKLCGEMKSLSFPVPWTNAGSPGDVSGRAGPAWLEGSDPRF